MKLKCFEYMKKNKGITTFFLIVIIILEIYCLFYNSDYPLYKAIGTIGPIIGALLAALVGFLTALNLDKQRRDREKEKTKRQIQNIYDLLANEILSGIVRCFEMKRLDLNNDYSDEKIYDQIWTDTRKFLYGNSDEFEILNLLQKIYSLFKLINDQSNFSTNTESWEKIEQIVSDFEKYFLKIKLSVERYQDFEIKLIPIEKTFSKNKVRIEFNINRSKLDQNLKDKICKNIDDAYNVIQRLKDYVSQNKN